ncbi:MAG: DegT/DnrJ/EryC1/StrS family aminotransferase, partial [Helcococcus sp.]|nr:DegT/DnrJ/EryC1/StrS family aminotransferase [Helcococcus sp.]
YGDKVKAVVIVHLYGVPGKIKEVKELCDKYNVVLIEDAAESLTATYDGKQTGSFGKYAALSFNGNKLITTSGGGMVIAQEAKCAEKAKFWATQAKEPVPYYLHKELGFNYRMSNITAGIGRGQFLHVDEHKKIKTEIYNRYKEGFKELPVKMNPYLKNTKPSHWLSAFSIDEELFEKGLTPEKLRIYLEDLNIESRRVWNPMHLQPFFEKYDFIKVEDKAVSKDIFDRGLCLPSDIKMTEEEQAKVIEIINDFVKEFVG